MSSCFNDYVRLGDDNRYTCVHPVSELGGDDIESLFWTGTICVFIVSDKSKGSRGGGKRCRCYERPRAKV